MKNLNKKQRFENHFFVLLGGLSGIYTCALLPLFMIKFYFDRNKYNFINFLILCFSNVIQFLLILNSNINNSLHSSVLKIDFSKDMLISFIYNIILKPFLGRDLTHSIWMKISQINDNYYIWIILLFVLFLSISIINLKKIFYFLKENYTTSYLMIIFFIILGIIIFGSLGNQLGGRYAVIPGALLILIVLDILFKSKSFLLSFLLFFDFYYIASGIYEFRPNYKVNLMCKNS